MLGEILSQAQDVVRAAELKTYPVQLTSQQLDIGIKALNTIISGYHDLNPDAIECFEAERLRESFWDSQEAFKSSDMVPVRMSMIGIRLLSQYYQMMIDRTLGHSEDPGLEGVHHLYSGFQARLKCQFTSAVDKENPYKSKKELPYTATLTQIHATHLERYVDAKIEEEVKDKRTVTLDTFRAQIERAIESRPETVREGVKIPYSEEDLKLIGGKIMADIQNNSFPMQQVESIFGLNFPRVVETFKELYDAMGGGVHHLGMEIVAVEGYLNKMRLRNLPKEELKPSERPPKSWRDTRRWDK